MKAVWQGRAMQVAARYGDQAPLAAVCCTACRTCTTTNLITLVMGIGLGGLYAAARLGKRIFQPR